jgi:hypothetical protein
MQWMNLPMLNIYRFLPLLFLLVAWRPLNAQRTWSFELHGGVTANMPLPLTIIQQNYPIIYFKQARYYSEPLKLRLIIGIGVLPNGLENIPLNLKRFIINYI